jgi:nickel-type superoxide dismutase maturation protease
MLKLFKISGQSLLPDYQEGDFVLTARLRRFLRSVERGDVVVFRHPRYGVMIKRVEDMGPEAGQVFVIGTNGRSVDSRRFGPVSMDELLGKVIWHIKTSPS